MKLDLTELKRLHDKAYMSGQTTRERGADDLVFYWVTQWDESVLDETQLAYRGEFNIIRKAGRNVLADLEENPVQVDFEPEDDERQDSAQLLDGLYRNDLRNNTSIESFSNADQEAVVCGVGAWLLYTDYVTHRGGKRDQVIKRKPIYEANNKVFWDPNAKLMDKSDATYCSVLCAYSEDGYKSLVEDLTGEDKDDIDMSNFAVPETSFVFPWVLGESKVYYVVDFYYRYKTKKKLYTLIDAMGQDITITEETFLETEEALLDDGFIVVATKDVEVYEVCKYIASGNEILDKAIIAGEHIPVVPEYGERAFIEDEEHYEGITRLAKDPQRLRNFQLSYLADIASRSPREKPIFTQEQIAGFEDMYSLSGSENNYPYALMNSRDAQGNPIPLQPMAMLPAPNIPPALGAVIELSRQAVEDVANPGVPQDIADPDTSGKAVLALQARLDKQSLVYQTHRKHARRRDGEIYASMAAVIYDVPRTVKVTKADGSQESMKTMTTVIDAKTGEPRVINDLRNIEFNVYSKITTNYKSQKDQTIDQMNTMLERMPQGDPMREILLLKTLDMMDGIDVEDIRKYANKQLLIKGIREPDNPQEVALLKQFNEQAKEPTAEMKLAEAEMVKGQASLMEAQSNQVESELNAQVKAMKAQIDAFNAETKRMEAKVDAFTAKATIDNKDADTLSKNIDTQAKVLQLRSPAEMSDDDLFAELMSASGT